MEKYTKKYPKDPSIRNHYYKLYSILTTSGVLSPLVDEERPSATSGLKTLHEENQKSYLKWIDKLQGTETEAIDPSTWASHFQKSKPTKTQICSTFQHSLRPHWRI